MKKELLKYFSYFILFLESWGETEIVENAKNTVTEINWGNSIVQQQWQLMLDRQPR